MCKLYTPTFSILQYLCILYIVYAVKERTRYIKVCNMRCGDNIEKIGLTTYEMPPAIFNSQGKRSL